MQHRFLLSVAWFVAACSLAVGSLAFAGFSEDFDPTHFQITSIRVEFHFDERLERLASTTVMKVSPKGAGRFKFQYRGEVTRVLVDGRETSFQVLTGDRTTSLLSPLYEIERVFQDEKEHTVVVEAQPETSVYRVIEGEILLHTNFNNSKGIGPETLFPTVNWPTFKPSLSIKFDSSIYRGDLSFATCNCNVTKRAGRLQLDWIEIPPLQIFFWIGSKSQLGARKELPITELGTTVIGFSEAGSIPPAFVEFGVADAAKALERMQGLFGAYPHGKQLILLFSKDGNSSMEYRGAVQSKPEHVFHEVIHQWFATSVMPKDFQAMCLMEAVTTWIEGRLLVGGFAEINAPDREDLVPFQLLPNSSERMNAECYTLGPRMLDEIDYRLAKKTQRSVRLLGVLQVLFQRYKGQFISIADFEMLLSETVAYDWANVFAAYMSPSPK